MKLNHECVRSLLLELEEKLLLDDTILMHNFQELDTVKKYGLDTSIYCFKKLIEAGFLNGNTNNADGKTLFLAVSALTWEGHKFLDTIRDTQVWANTKAATSKVSSVSLSMLSMIGGEFLKKQLGL